MARRLERRAPEGFAPLARRENLPRLRVNDTDAALVEKRRNNAQTVAQIIERIGVGNNTKNAHELRRGFSCGRRIGVRFAQNFAQRARETMPIVVELLRRHAVGQTGSVLRVGQIESRFKSPADFEANARVAAAREPARTRP